jgi:dolichol-phosphate mannosyltransferase
MSDNQQQNHLRKLSDIHLGIVCPMANEKDTAIEFVKAVLDKCTGFKQVSFFVIFDNNCKDGTVDLLRELAKETKQLRVVWAPENTCVVDAYVKVYKEALAAGCNWILEMDAGFSHQPDEIPQFFEKMAKGYDCVFGSRFCEGGRFTDSPWRRRFISRGGTILANVLLGTRLADMTSGFEMFTHQSLEKVLEKGIRSKGHFFQTEIKTYCRKMNVTEVPIHYRRPSQNVDAAVLLDSFKNLFALFLRRLRGQL